ncbi:hypothetical protein FA13DRAFT_324050 [Coprinellus micaceus]|uniref:Uncharacterized protein n=1 Tax=Coprinellus micaceus TaxID=71717 RepID=A0A4Y7SDZ8_COPMI|nr:hypothetical protein FA13DRAFT_324050 [Coprinellus micaceus]
MGQRLSSLAAGQRVGGGEIYEIDIVIEQTDGSEDFIPSLDLTQIWILQDEITRFSLKQMPPKRWEASGYIKLSSGIQPMLCTVKGSDGEDFSSASLDCSGIQRKVPGLEHSTLGLNAQNLGKGPVYCKLRWLWLWLRLTWLWLWWGGGGLRNAKPRSAEPEIWKCTTQGSS